MNIDSLTIGDAKKLAAMLQGQGTAPIDTGMVGKYVIVRCKDAGVHAGELVSHNGRECVLNDSRRLWYWKPANNAAFLSGVASEGLDKSSKVGEPVRIHLTENCEIIETTEAAEKSIRAAVSYDPS